MLGVCLAHFLADVTVEYLLIGSIMLNLGAKIAQLTLFFFLLHIHLEARLLSFMLLVGYVAPNLG